MSNVSTGDLAYIIGSRLTAVTRPNAGRVVLVGKPMFYKDGTPGWNVKPQGGPLTNTKGVVSERPGMCRDSNLRRIAGPGDARAIDEVSTLKPVKSKAPA